MQLTKVIISREKIYFKSEYRQMIVTVYIFVRASFSLCTNEEITRFIFYQSYEWLEILNFESFQFSGVKFCSSFDISMQ